MFLQDFPSCWIVPAASKPELVARIVCSVDKDIAPRNCGFGQPGKAKIDKPRTDATATMGFGNGEVIKEASATVVSAENCTDNFTRRCSGNRAETGIALQEQIDRLLGIRFSKAETFDPRPKHECAFNITHGEGANYDGRRALHSRSNVTVVPRGTRRSRTSG